MRAKLIRVTGLNWFSIVLLLLTGEALRVQAAEMRLQAFLLWGTDDAKPPEGKAYKPAGPDVVHKLKELPLKWTNWFEVNRADFAVPQGAVREVPMSEKCRVRVSNINSSDAEVLLIGRGREVVKRKQALPKGEMLVLGGNAPNATAWLVVLKRIE
jgi:hypothetical protein